MPTRIALNKYFSHGFVLTEQEVRRIYDFLLERMKLIAGNDVVTATVELYLADSTVIEPISLDEVFSEDNSGRKEIRTLKMNFFPQNDLNTEIALLISKDSVRIRYLIKTVDRDWAYVTSSRLEDRIRKVSRGDYKYLGMLLFPILTAILLFYKDVPFTQFDAQATPADLIIIFSILAISIAIYNAISICYPACNFLWGDYVKHFNKRQSIGKFILFSVVLVLFLGVVQAYLNDWLGVPGSRPTPTP